jgi:sigma-B regulation protein RsbU (phosphoserine phosphatase)
MDALQRELTELRQRDESHRETMRRHNDELREASALQRDLVHATRPDIRGVDVHTVYRPAQTVSGDIYDITRLDGERIAISLADVTGHGLPAALLTAFVKRGLRNSEVLGGRTHRFQPDEVLDRLNRDVLDAQLQECQFVTAINAIYNEQTGVIRWARGGAPYPILARRGESPRRIVSKGGLLGALPGSKFEVVEMRLSPGDVLMFHTDGLDPLLCDETHGIGSNEIEQAAWVRDLGHQPTRQLLKDLEHRFEQAQASPETSDAVDDLSVLILEVRSPELKKPLARTRSPHRATGADKPSDKPIATLRKQRQPITGSTRWQA